MTYCLPWFPAPETVSLATWGQNNEKNINFELTCVHTDIIAVYVDNFMFKMVIP